jgi:hypothetical protein
VIRLLLVEVSDRPHTRVVVLTSFADRARIVAARTTAGS